MSGSPVARTRRKRQKRLRGFAPTAIILTPKLGALSADTWTAVAIWFRNLIINWFLLIPLIAAAAVAPQLISALMGAAEGSSWAMAVQIIGICFYAVGLVVFNGARPRWQAFNLNQRNFLIFSLLPLIISAVLWAITMAHASALTSLWRSFIPAQIGPLSLPIPDYIFLVAVLYLVATAVSWVWNKYYAPPYIRRTITSSEARLLRYSFSLTRAAAAGASVVVYTEDHQAAAGKHYLTASNEIVFPPGQIESRNKFDIELTGEPIGKEPVKDGDVFIKFRDPHELRIGGVFGSARASDVLAFVFSGACFGLFVGAGDLLLRPPSGQAVSAWHHLGISAFAVPWLLLSHALATVIFVALTSWLPRSDEEREWIGRAGGWVLVIALLWTGIAALVLLLPKAISDILTYYGIGFSTIDTRKVAALVVSAFGGISGIFTAVVGGGPKTAANSWAAPIELAQARALCRSPGLSRVAFHWVVPRDRLAGVRREFLKSHRGAEHQFLANRRRAAFLGLHACARRRNRRSMHQHQSLLAA